MRSNRAINTDVLPADVARILAAGNFQSYAPMMLVGH